MSMNEPSDFGQSPAGEVRRWLKELDLADEQEKAWRVQGQKIWDRYRGTKRRKNSFNILWSNTETLAPALFNSPPEPDVRRRYRDEDPVGKQTAEVLQRCLKFQTDTEQFMSVIKADVLDCILPGRGVSRVKYVPTLVPMQTPYAAEEQAEGDEQAGQSAETAEGDEQLAWEQCEVEHVQWDDFRHGPGKTWEEVQWVAFRHRMNKEELEKLTADPETSSDAARNAINSIPMDNCADESIEKDHELKTVFGTVEVWELWCREYRQVFYVTRAWKDDFLKRLEDPLHLTNFYPCARPLYAIQDSACLVPTPIFEQYAEQAEELDRISTRLIRIVDALRVRGIYDATMAELNELMRADDNKLIPMQNAALWADKGGIEKAIWMMPIDQAASVLQVLVNAREQCKQTIYELSGIADVRRGTSDPNETLGAQKLKANFGDQRISGLKIEVQRYVRDILRLMSEVVSDRFQPETLFRMSQVQLQTEQQVQQKVMQTQMQAAQAGQDPQQAIQALGPRPITVEQVLQVLRDDATRMFKIEVETDSMVAATSMMDMEGLREVLGGVSQVMQAFAPAIQMGAMPTEALKEIIMVVCRRARMGNAVEDALNKMTEPKPQPDKEGQAAQMKAQVDMQTAQIKAQSDAQVAQIKAQYQQQTDIIRQRAEAEQHQMKIDSEAQLAQLKAQFQDQFERWKAELQAATTIQVAQINSAAKGVIQMNPATQAATEELSREIRP